MHLESLVPWRVRHAIDRFMEARLRVRHPRLYKLLKFGRTNLNTPEYWNEVWRTDTENRHYAQLFALILAHVPEGARVLDVGCGAGLLLRELRARRRAAVTGLDFSRWACERLRAEGFDAVESALPHIPFPDGAFDVVVATEVLEHLDHPERTLAQMARVAKPGGTLMVSVPNDVMHPHEELEHQQSFTPERLRALMERVSRSVELYSAEYLEGDRARYLLARGTV
jgi:2-polyprenyl-3-methyl-5-hydroxy-6-metoxy-1,4-benzoquinol methylase